MRVSTRARSALHARLRPATPHLRESSAIDCPACARRGANRRMLGVTCAALATSTMILAGWNFRRIDDRSAVPAELTTLAASAPAPVRLIGATTTITEVSTGLPFAARVDTGATTCAIHCETLEIDGAHRDARKNVGKPIRFLVRNKDGQAKWIESTIVDHVNVRTAGMEEERYKVRLTLRWQDVEKPVAVTLDNRSNMGYPLLLGRNFLRDDFLVNVNLNGSR